MINRKAPCQYCGTEKTKYYVPYGSLCDTCRKNLDIIRKNKLGIPSVKRKGSQE